jgi:transposase
MIRKEFGISYHPAHVSRVVRALGLSLHKPMRRANQRDEQAIRRWKAERWPELKKGIEGRQDNLVRGPTGFYLLPTVVRTYAPIGQTPVLHEQLSRDHLSVISGISLEGKLYMMEQERSFKSQDIVRFLRHLLRQIEGKLLVVWDGSPIHRGQAVKDFLASGASSRLQLEQLPGYAPDLNPEEGIWKHLKYVELKNVCCRNLSELTEELR